jgi:endoglucanase
VKELIKKYCDILGPSGMEDAVRDAIIEDIKSSGAEYETDPNGNLIVFKKGKKTRSKKVLLSAHMDEVGMMITAITSEGFLRFVKVGGIDSRVMLGRAVKVGDKGVSGFIGIKPVHLVEKGQDADIEKIKEDIRTRDYQDMNRTVAPLRQAEDAVVIDSSSMTIDEVMNCIVDAFQESLKLKG